MAVPTTQATNNSTQWEHIYRANPEMVADFGGFSLKIFLNAPQRIVEYWLNNAFNRRYNLAEDDFLPLLPAQQAVADRIN